MKCMSFGKFVIEWLSWKRGKSLKWVMSLMYSNHRKQPITKRFVSQVTEPAEAKQALAHIKEEFPAGTLIKLVFVGERTEQPVLAGLIRKFNVDVNIVQGNISHTHGGAYGTLIFQLVGDDSDY